MTINAFGKELKFKNKELELTYKLSKEQGYRVHTSIAQAKDVITYFYIDNGISYGYVEARYSGVSYSTCHKPKKYIGSGYSITGLNNIDVASIEKINETLKHYTISRDGRYKVNAERQTFSEFSEKEFIKFEEI